MIFPCDQPLPDAEDLGQVPMLWLQAAFPLHRWIVRSYPGKRIGQTEEIFNYRLSLTSILVESAFGILAARWRVCDTKVAVKPAFVSHIVKATCGLHNLLQGVSTTAQMTSLSEEIERGRILGMEDMGAVGKRSETDAIQIREKF